MSAHVRLPSYDRLRWLGRRHRCWLGRGLRNEADNAGMLLQLPEIKSRTDPDGVVVLQGFRKSNAPSWIVVGIFDPIRQGKI